MHLSEVLWGSEGEPEGSTNLIADRVASGVLEIAMSWHQCFASFVFFIFLILFNLIF
jgi:hypothetical protein